MLEWLYGNWVEILGVLLSWIYLVLSIRQHIFLWPTGILSALLYIIVFFQAKFYADMGLNVYYFIISIYGWINWNTAKNRTGDDLPVSGISRSMIYILAIIGILCFVSISFILKEFTDSPLPYWDAFTTSASIIATWMLTKKMIQHWLIWIVVDLVSMGLYIYRGLYPTSLLFFTYTIMAVIGYRQWSISLKKV